MTEQEWLTSGDPQALVRVLLGLESMDSGRRVVCQRPSDRKMRLFACAVARMMRQSDWQDGILDAAEMLAETGKMPNKYVGAGLFFCDSDAERAASWAANPAVGSPMRKQAGFEIDAAAQLRDVFGNPFRPVTLGRECAICNGTGHVVHKTLSGISDQTVYHHKLYCKACLGEGRVGRREWLTPQVVELATAAYEERGRKCRRCGGTGQVRNFIARGTGDDATEYWNEACPDCANGSGLRGTGVTTDGTLDPFRLALVADALEEAGCPPTQTCSRCKGKTKVYVSGTPYDSGWEDCPDCKHTRRRVATGSSCPKCGKPGRWRSGVGFEHERICTAENCWTSWEPGETVIVIDEAPHPILAHLRSSGPHVRGCWALDLILGRS